MLDLYLIIKYLAYFDLFNLKYPATVIQTLKHLRSIVEFDMLELDIIIELIISVSSETKKSSQS